MDKKIFIDGKSLASLKVAELKEELTKRNLPKTGNKQELYNRLRACITGGKGKPENSSENSTSTAIINGKPIDKFTVPELKVELKKRNLPIDGVKVVLCTRLSNYLKEYGEGVDVGSLYANADALNVFMVAEKPIMANQISKILGKGKKIGFRKGSNGACSINEWTGEFMGKSANFKMTSTCGHDFPDEYRDWRKHQPIELFDCSVEKSDANPQLKMRKFLASEAKDANILVLWLDCDMEGENICFEVIEAVRNAMKKSPTGNFMDIVYRARFSALKDVPNAMNCLIKPNFKQSLSVDCRRELDLRIGVAFSRFQTSHFRRYFRDRDVKLISYGPCQTPALSFCVNRAEKVENFNAENYWVLSCELESESGKVIKADCLRGQIRDENEANALLEKIRTRNHAKVIEVKGQQTTKERPKAMNTVEMLKIASTKLGISPADTIHKAENLYTRGYISYPRTETTEYPEEFEYMNVLKFIEPTLITKWTNNSLTIDDVMKKFTYPRKGVDKGDHPPIVPMQRLQPKSTDEASEGLYNLIVKHFVSTVMPPCVQESQTVLFQVGDEEFQAQSTLVVDPGFTILNEPTTSDEQLNFTVGDSIKIKKVKLTQRKTTAPTYLTEAELVAKMEKHSIGTDASIPTHIQNICQRNYVKVETGRKLVPTKLGRALIKAYQELDSEMAFPKTRADVEAQVNLIARNEADYDQIKSSVLDKFKQKFYHFSGQAASVNHLFEDCFPPRENYQDARNDKHQVTQNANRNRENRGEHSKPNHPKKFSNRDGHRTQPQRGGYHGQQNRGGHQGQGYRKPQPNHSKLHQQDRKRKAEFINSPKKPKYPRSNQ